VINERKAMNSRTNENQPACVSITVKFVSIMQKYSGNKREVQVEVPTDPAQAIHLIINRFQIPWQGNLEKSTRIFINQTLNDPFVDRGQPLKDKDTIAFIPISGGG
jgi:molybdopterin converting factor small subunit